MFQITSAISTSFLFQGEILSDDCNDASDDDEDPVEELSVKDFKGFIDVMNIETAHLKDKKGNFNLLKHTNIFLNYRKFLKKNQSSEEKQKTKKFLFSANSP